MDLLNLLKSLIFYSNNKCLFCLEEDYDKEYICDECLRKLEYVDKKIEISQGIKCFYPYYYNGFLKDKFTKEFSCKGIFCFIN